MKKYFYGGHYIDDNDIRSITLSLNKTLSQGPLIKKFEKNVAKYFNSKYCVAVSSATAALHISIAALNLKKNSKVFLPTMTFVATANACIYNRLNLNLIDIDSNNFNIDFDILEKELSKESKREKKLIIPVHFGGLPCNMTKIGKIAKKYNCYVVEDASQAMGARFKNKLVGNCKFSDFTIFSLHPVKSITTGEGGLILTNNYKFFRKVSILRSHGLVKDSKHHWKNDMKLLGYNYKFTEFQSALGISQLQKLKKFLSKRHEIAKFYSINLNKNKVKFQKYDKNLYYHAYHYFILRFKKKLKPNKFNKLINFLKKSHIYVGRQYKPLHLHTFYRSKFKKKFPISEDYYNNSFQIPIYPKLSNLDLKYILIKLKLAFKKFTDEKKK